MPNALPFLFPVKQQSTASYSSGLPPCARGSRGQSPLQIGPNEKANDFALE